VLTKTGIVMTAMGCVQNFVGLFVARLFLGATEAGLFPGVSFYLTQWYRKYEISFRISLFFSAATAAGAFGGLLARLINLMDGTGGYEGWRWIFILEGILTVIVAIASFWVMYDYPDTAKFLTEPERKVVQARLRLDNDGCSHAFKMKYVWDAFTDWKVWLSAVQFHGALCPLYTFSLFSPTLVASLGYEAARAQLMSVPPYVAAAACTMTVGYLSDRLRMRGIFCIVFGSISALGYGLLLANINNGVNYFALFLAACGVYPLIPVIVAWGSNNCGGALKKSVATAIVVSIGNLGGIVSSFMYPTEHAKTHFKMGHSICLGYSLIVVVTAVIQWSYCAWANKRKDERNAARTHPWTEAEKAELEDRGDHNDWFRYAI
jgi:MFS family permease